MRVKVKFFGTASAYFGSEPKQMEVPEGAAVGDLLEVIAKQWGKEAESFLQNMTFVVNQSRADRTTLLSNGDEVLVIFTLGGG